MAPTAQQIGLTHIMRRMYSNDDIERSCPMVFPFDYTSPSAQFTFDVNTSTLFKKDSQNFINVLGIQQLNTLDNVSLLDIFLVQTM